MQALNDGGLHSGDHGRISSSGLAEALVDICVNFPARDAAAGVDTFCPVTSKSRQVCFLSSAMSFLR